MCQKILVKVKKDEKNQKNFQKMLDRIKEAWYNNQAVAKSGGAKVFEN